MIGLLFEEQAPVVVSDPNRADIACFVGFVDRRLVEPPDHIKRWLAERGWADDDLLDVPVPIDNWDLFDQLFAWDQRDYDGQGLLGTSYMGAAIRSFFAQGGRKCYVVRVGDTWPIPTAADGREEVMAERLALLVPGYPSRVTSDPVDPASWAGIGHLHGLPDVFYLCMPDLADIVAAVPPPLEQPEPIPGPPEQFVECSQPLPAPPPDNEVRRLQAPRCDDAGYAAWETALRRTASLIAEQRREVQLVAGVPLPEVGSPAERNILDYLVNAGTFPLATSLVNGDTGLSSAFAQLVYPWAKTPGSVNMPQQLESPDGIVTGLLARNALLAGAYRNAGWQSLGDVYEVSPIMSRQQMLEPVAIRDDDDGSDKRPAKALIERISLLGPTPDGWRLLSDVTTSLDEHYRPANVNRLVSIIVRAARHLGQDTLFEPSGELLWSRLRDKLTDLLLGFYAAGALRGATPAEAFSVRCDRSTMTQADIDNGRVVAEIVFEAASSIEQITVVLAMDEAGQVSLASTEATS